MGEILHLFQATAHGQPVVEFDEVSAIENKGFKDCVKGRRGNSRQVLLMDVETLDELGVAPGQLKENITTRDITLHMLSIGQKLRVGEALLEVTQKCERCHLLDSIRLGLRDVARGRRGVLCRVIESGQVRRGDVVEIVGQIGANDSKSRSAVSMSESDGAVD